MSNRRFRFWLLRLIPSIKYGRILTGVVIFAILYPSLSLGNYGAAAEAVRTPSLFFSLIIAYIVPVFSYTSERMQAYFDELKTQIEVAPKVLQRMEQKIRSNNLMGMMLPILIGTIFGIAHISLIRGSLATQMVEAVTSLVGFASTVGTVLVWVVMTVVISAMIQQLSVFSQLGRKCVKVNLLNTRALLPFGRVSVIASLTIIGSLALFPLLNPNGGLELVQLLPAVLGTSIPLIATMLLPVWPIHQRIRDAKSQELSKIDAKILGIQQSAGVEDLSEAHLAKLSPLFDYRQEINQVSTWPYDGGVISRFGFYMIIPPLTWVGAALIENLVDGFL